MTRDQQTKGIPTRRRWIIAICLAGAVALGAAIAVVVTSNGSNTAVGRLDSDRVRSSYLGLCRAEDAVAKGDANQAARIFLDSSHLPLHELAAQVQAKNPVVAGNLLQGKVSSGNASLWSSRACWERGNR